MKFDTAYYWQQGANAASLALQQAVCRKKGETIVLACVCTDEPGRDKNAAEGAAFCRHLIDWFHERGLGLCRGRGMDWNGLRSESGRIAGYAGTGFSFAGILCVGAQFVLFHRGQHKICLLNTRFARPHLRCLTEEQAEGAGSHGMGEVCGAAENSKVHTEEGMLEKDIGLLLITDSFYGKLTEHMILGCLGAGSISNEKQASRRLRELGEFGERQGARDMGAVLLVSR